MPQPQRGWETCSHTCLVCCSCEKSRSSFGRKKKKSKHIISCHPTQGNTTTSVYQEYIQAKSSLHFFLVPLKLHVLFLPIAAIAQKPHHVHPTLVPRKLRQKEGASLMLVTLRAPKCLAQMCLQKDGSQECAGPNVSALSLTLQHNLHL